MLLVQVITERFLCVEVGAGTVWAHKLPVVTLCGAVNKAADVLNVGIVGGLLILVVQDVCNLCTSVHAHIQCCDGTLLFIHSQCVHIEVEERILLFKLLEIFICQLHRHLKRTVHVDPLLSD